MAVITLDRDKNRITVLVEKSDHIQDKSKNITEVRCGKQYATGDIFVNGEIELCMVRGERE